MNEIQSNVEQTSTEAGATRPHLYSEDSAMKPSPQTADFLLASCLRRANEGIQRRNRRRKNEILAAVIQSFGLIFLAAVLATKL